MKKTNKQLRKEFETRAFGSVPVTRHLIMKNFDQALQKQREEILEELLLGVVDGHTPDFILDSPDGRIRKAYKKLLEPTEKLKKKPRDTRLWDERFCVHCGQYGCTRNHLVG